jgi:hypothetical protein
VLPVIDTIVAAQREKLEKKIEELVGSSPF